MRPASERERRPRAFVIKADVLDPTLETYRFVAQKTMYGGKHIASGDPIFIFASETDGGSGLVAQGVVTSVQSVVKTPGVTRQTPRVSLTIRRTASVKRALGRSELKRHTDWASREPGAELNFKLYRQATNKVVGISPQATTFLQTCF